MTRSRADSCLTCSNMTDEQTKADEQANSIKVIEDEAAKLESLIEYRSEAGVFKEPNADKFESIVNAIKDARKSAKDDPAEANRQLMIAYNLLHQATLSRSAGWRWINIYAVDIAAYYVVVFALLIVLGLWCLLGDGALPEAIWGVPLPVIVFGVFGGILRGLWWLYQKVQNTSFRVQFRIVYFIGPVLAAVLGMLSFFLAGALTLNLDDVATAGSTASGQVTPGVNLLAFLAGFSWEWITSRVYKLTQ